MNYTRPPLAITIDPIRSAFVDAKKRHMKLRYITEITEDNISYCKELISLVDELRHLDGIKGNFMVSESEYLAPIILCEKGKIASEIICSNQKELVDQQQYMFETLWDKSISAEQRIKEIEEGIIADHYQTRFLENPNEVSEEIKKTINTSEDDSWSICSTFDGLLMLTYNKGFEQMQGRLLNSSKRGNNTRWVGAINKDNTHLVKVYLDLGMKIKHINNMPPMNFAISSKELYATIDEMKGGQIAKNLLVSNEPHYVKHFKFVFEDLWRNGTDASERIRAIEQGIDLEGIKVIHDSNNAKEQYLNLVKGAKNEIMVILPTLNAFACQQKIGVSQCLIDAANKRDVKIRILMPAISCNLSDNDNNNDNLTLQSNKAMQQAIDDSIIDVRYIEQISDNKATISIADRKVSLVMEMNDDSKETFDKSFRLAIYSNSISGVLSYVTIFENLWKQTDLYQQLKKSNKQLEEANEQLKKRDKAQKEFINVAAHELRTPIQPILGLTQIIYRKIDEDVTPYEKQKQKEMLEVIIRNANRLQRLSEDILDVTRIESQNLNLKLEGLNLDEIILNAINDVKRNHQIKDNVNLLYQRDEYDNLVLAQADRGRLNQVISNLINNAIKFTKEGSIVVNAKKEERENKVIVSVKDTGIGIDPEILPRLFQKFASKSYQGTGLGLYISKSIVEVHGGRMWAENNADGKGAVFYFTLPTI
jgi:two-component system sensor histidine kinase VicK